MIEEPCSKKLNISSIPSISSWSEMLETPNYDDVDYNIVLFDDDNMNNIDILGQPSEMPSPIQSFSISNHPIQSSYPYEISNVHGQIFDQPTSHMIENSQKRSNMQVVVEKNHEFDMYPDNIQYELFFKELPSRCIMMSNVPEDVSKEEMTYLFAQFGEYESFDLSKINEGVANVTFYDLESAERMRISKISLHNRCIVTIFGEEQMVIKDPKHPPNNGTLVAFHVPPDLTENEIIDLFSPFGKIRGVRRTPNKETQRFIEFYDKRKAERAMKYFNSNVLIIKGRKHKISLEFSLPGNYRANNAKFYQTKLPTIQRNKKSNIQ